MSLEQQQVPAEQAPPVPPRRARGKKTPPSKPEHCLNCGAAATGNFCAECGQENEDQTVALKLLAQDLLSDVASFDSKLFRTLVPLIIRPGFLTCEYNAGKRVRYLSPFKLYLTFSLLFFLAVPLTHQDRLLHIDTSDAARAAASVKAANAKVQADKDVKDTQAELKDDLQDAPPGLSLPPMQGHATLALGPSSYDLTHLPATVEAYNAKQRDPRVHPDPKAVQFIKRQVIKVRQSPQLLSAALLDDIPKMMFVLLPLFALSLKLVYIRSKRLYIEHLVFSLHLHAFLFLLLTLLLAVQSVTSHAAYAGPVTTVAALLYPYLAMRIVYRQGWLKTFVKYNLLAFNYVFLLTFTLIGALLAAFLVL